MAPQKEFMRVGPEVILHACMHIAIWRSGQVLVSAFIYVHALVVQAVKALVKLQLHRFI